MALHKLIILNSRWLKVILYGIQDKLAPLLVHFYSHGMFTEQATK